jgi:hypothetical protein
MLHPLSVIGLEIDGSKACMLDGVTRGFYRVVPLLFLNPNMLIHCTEPRTHEAVCEGLPDLLTCVEPIKR